MEMKEIKLTNGNEHATETYYEKFQTGLKTKRLPNNWGAIPQNVSDLEQN